MEDKIGYIYVLTNPSFPEYVKIGYADNVDARVAQLNRSECIPFAFKKYAVLPVASRLADRNVHNLIEQFKPELRAKENVNGKIRVREFFAMTAQEAVEILDNIGGIYGETPQLFEQTVEEKRDQEIAEKAAIASERKSPLSFFKCGIKEGELITYVYDANITCTVANDREINYNGRLTSLSALAKKLLNRKSGVQGTLYFTYDGEILSALRKRLEDEGRYKEIEQTETCITALTKDDSNNQNGILLYFTMEKYTATCVWSNDGFLLLKGAKLSITSSKSCPVAIVKMREKKSTIINGERILSEDILFESSSAAAKFIAGSSVNGNVYWKNAEGVLLKNLQK